MKETKAPFYIRLTYYTEDKSFLKWKFNAITGEFRKEKMTSHSGAYTKVVHVEFKTKAALIQFLEKANWPWKWSTKASDLYKIPVKFMNNNLVLATGYGELFDYADGEWIYLRKSKKAANPQGKKYRGKRYHCDCWACRPRNTQPQTNVNTRKGLREFKKLHCDS